MRKFRILKDTVIPIEEDSGSYRDLFCFAGSLIFMETGDKVDGITTIFPVNPPLSEDEMLERVNTFRGIKSMPIVKLENWAVVPSTWFRLGQDPDPEFFRPLQVGEYSLFGKAYGHRRIEDGHRVRTSPIKEIIEDKGVITVKTETGTIYELGKRHPKYVEYYRINGLAHE